MTESNTWIEGDIQFSPGYGSEFKCLRRWFEGYLELVELQRLDSNRNPIGEPFARTACAMSTPIFPKITEHRGGVLDASQCKHEPHARISTKAYGLICGLCGAPMDKPL